MEKTKIWFFIYTEYYYYSCDNWLNNYYKANLYAKYEGRDCVF